MKALLDEERAEKGRDVHRGPGAVLNRQRYPKRLGLVFNRNKLCRRQPITLESAKSMAAAEAWDEASVTTEASA